ncbi:hypothetical protein JCM11491_001768 [Sporobolomyces phaffii]
MSDNSSPPRTSSRGTTERRAALERRKDASSSKSKRPTFLGAEDDDDAFDFEAFSRPAASSRTRPPPRSAGGDALGNGFDDLFDLDDPNAPKTATGGEFDDILKGDDLDAEAGPVKKRKVVAKMDETRLLGPTGFPRLMQDIKRVKIKGKGHETQDLKRILSVYQLWTHQMYPKTNLRDTLTTVEKLCHKRSLQRALKGYKDEYKNGKSSAGQGEFAADPSFEAHDEEETGIFAGLNKKGSQSQQRSDAGGGGPVAGDGGRAAIRDEGDTFDAADLDDLFGEDEDALMAALEAEAMAGSGRGHAAGRDPTKKGAETSATRGAANEDYDEDGQDDPEDDDDEAMAAMREMEELLG